MQGDPVGNYDPQPPLKLPLRTAEGGESYYLWCGQDAEIYWKGKYLRVPICAPRYGRESATVAHALYSGP